MISEIRSSISWTLAKIIRLTRFFSLSWIVYCLLHKNIVNHKDKGSMYQPYINEYLSSFYTELTRKGSNPKILIHLFCNNEPVS